jgi:hypothetical protein
MLNDIRCCFGTDLLPSQKHPGWYWTTSSGGTVGGWTLTMPVWKNIVTDEEPTILNMNNCWGCMSPLMFGQSSGRTYGMVELTQEITRATLQNSNDRSFLFGLKVIPSTKQQLPSQPEANPTCVQTLGFCKPRKSTNPP